jgi:hypothetical protein
LRFLFFITASEIFYDSKNKCFFYNINVDYDNEYLIMKIVENKTEYLFIQPDLNSFLKNNTEGLTSKYKYNKFLAWSIGIIILKHVLKIELEEIMKMYSDCLITGEKINLLKSQNLKKRFGFDELEVLNKFFDCNDETDENILINYLK